MKQSRIRVLANATRSLSIQTIVASLTLLLLLSTSVLILTSVEGTDRLNAVRLKIHDIPGITHVLGPSKHSPPSKDSPSISKTWLSSLSWLNPFSKPQDEDRVVLPVLQPRCPVYTYYDPKNEFDKDVRDELLLVWRRAWWAQGFKPIILGPSEALGNGLYKQVQMQKHSSRLRYEIMRFLAWAYMEGGGVFADYRTIPLASYDDPGLTSLRRCDNPSLNGYQSQEGYIYSTSSAPAINRAVQHILSLDESAWNSTSIEEASKSDPGKVLWLIKPKLNSLAIYSPPTIEKLYESLLPANLSTLMNAHIHSYFLESHGAGIDVLQPYPDLTGAIYRQTNSLAQRLATCPSSPWPYKCPPNQPKCKICTAESSPPVTILSTITKPTKNGNPLLPNNTFTLSAVIHPYIALSILTANDTTFADMVDKLDEPFMQRYSKRDPYVLFITENIVPPTLAAVNRTITVKQAIAGRQESYRGFWYPSESELVDKELSWVLGFSIPKLSAQDHDHHQHALDPHSSLAKKVTNFLTTNLDKNGRAKDPFLEKVELWNPADTEVWRFTRALGERRALERKTWMDGERRFVQGGWADGEDADGTGNGRGHGWGFGSWFGI